MNTSRAKLWLAVALANVASYLAVGPLYYYGTRPALDGLEFMATPQQATTCSEAVYFIAADTKHLQRINANGDNLTTAIPHPVRDYLVSSDQKAFLYRGTKTILWYYLDGQEPQQICKLPYMFRMPEVDLSADKAYVAYATKTKLAVWSAADASVITEIDLPKESGEYVDYARLAWDAEISNLLHCQLADRLHSWRLEDDSLVHVETNQISPVGNFRRWNSGVWTSRDNWGIRVPWRQEQGDLTLSSDSEWGSHVSIKRKGELVARINNKYGWLGGGLPGPGEAYFLNQPGVVIGEGRGTIFVIDILNKRVAELVKGHNSLATSDRFQASFKEQE